MATRSGAPCRMSARMACRLAVDWANSPEIETCDAVASGGVLAQAPTCGPYRVAFYETGLLYFKDKKGEYVGIDRAVLDEVARRTGCVFEPFMDSRVRTWARWPPASWT